MNENSSQRSDSLFYRGEAHYFKSLEKLAIPLRQTAREMTTFIEKLDPISSALQDLKRAYAALESTPIKEIYKSLELVASHLTKVDFLEPQPSMNTPDLKRKKTKQNQISTQV